MHQLSIFSAGNLPAPPAGSTQIEFAPARSDQNATQPDCSASAAPSFIPVPLQPQPIEQSPEHQPTRSLAPTTPAQAKAIAPTAAPDFDLIKNCRLSGALIKHSRLDHSLCSGDCGWVVDLIWLAQHHRQRDCASVARSNQPEEATTHHETSAGETLDLFIARLDRNASEAGGAA
ncbi:MAG: hypothetical protein HC895_03665 [Leptolyngbyaceae cyanobacterium SM1_3_5]|nr:hypothetical protein [Leptolyngbyaceae cyanobacterium SM1_3_5]